MGLNLVRLEEWPASHPVDSEETDNLDLWICMIHKKWILPKLSLNSLEILGPAATTRASLT